ncbi:hypothetical protein ACHABX_11055 [Nesterenkonia halotolerans]|uniref:hypothetical protein n=1 Tax=Nesterenkonia halotolerans TaxID=225325 RepID=UPI003EE7FF64
MGSFELLLNDERFRVSERVQPDGHMSYDFHWLNGPAEGTYGFTVGCAPLGALMTRRELEAAARNFVESFYEPGGIGDEDFPDHIAAKKIRQSGK